MSCACEQTDRATAAHYLPERSNVLQGTDLGDKKSRSNVSRELWELVATFEEHKASGTQEEFRPASSFIRVRSGRVAIDCTASEDTARLAADLEALGMTGIATFGNMVGGWLPIEAVPRLPELDSLRFARAAMAMTNQ